MIVAIDGTSGSGKSTISKLVAQKMNFAYIQTGAFYRAITHQVVKRRIKIDDAKKVTELLENLKITADFQSEHAKICVNGKNITKELYSPKVSINTSIVASIKAVRAYVRKLQKETSKQYSDIIMEGRDIGSVIFPNADLKVFVDCDVAERAKRRYKQYVQSGQKADLKKIKSELIERDYNDTHRAISPLVRLPEAYYLDTTKIPIEQCADLIVQQIEEKRKNKK